jgi:transposase
MEDSSRSDELQPVGSHSDTTAASAGKAAIKKREAAAALEPKRTARLRKPQRMQIEILLRCKDDLVRPTHPVRTVEKVLEQLDLSRFYDSIKAREGAKGRDATDPKLLLAVWLYACLRGIGRAREVARRCAESLPFLWLLGGVTVNYHLLSDFRKDHEAALDELFTQVVASLVDKGVVKVSRISQDGLRVRVGAGASSFRREERLGQLLEEAKQHVEELKKQLSLPGAASVTKRQQAARERAARERQQRLEEAIAQLPAIKAKQEGRAQKAGKGKEGEKIRKKQPRVSSTDAEARVLKMPNGGFNPAVNMQVASDPVSRAIVGVNVSNEGSDSSNLSAPMRQQVEERTGGKVEQHLIDGGYMKLEDIAAAHEQGVELFVPPKPARNKQNRGHELEPKPGDSEAILDWKRRMGSAEGKEIYKQRASTSETVNADLRTQRGLNQVLVRGLKKAKYVVLWSALAYNVMHFSSALLS